MIKIFISYAHADAQMCARLRKHLHYLEEAGTATFFVDERVDPGEPLKATILDHLAQAHMALLLISVDFLWSRFITDHELPAILDRAKRGNLVYVPVILKSVSWQALDIKGVGGQLAVPRDGKPIQKFRPLDDGYVDAVQRIDRTVTRLSASHAR